MIGQPCVCVCVYLCVCGVKLNDQHVLCLWGRHKWWSGVSMVSLGETYKSHFFWWFWRHHQWFNGVKVKLVGPARKLSRVKHRGIGWESQITFFCSCGASTACWVGQHGWRHWRQHGWLSGGQTRCVGWDSQVTIFLCMWGHTGWLNTVGGGWDSTINMFSSCDKNPACWVFHQWQHGWHYGWLGRGKHGA